MYSVAYCTVYIGYTVGCYMLILKIYLAHNLFFASTVYF